MVVLMQDISPTPLTAADVCDALGRKEMASRLERTTAAISNAASEGVFPAGWYLIISEMCAARGIDCPPSLFKFLVPVEPTPTDPSTPTEEDAA
jgi:hypothetical protein